MGLVEQWAHTRERVVREGLHGPAADFRFADVPGCIFSNVDRLRRTPSVTFWLGSTVDDRLSLAFAIQLLDNIRSSLPVLSLVSVRGSLAACPQPTFDAARRRPIASGLQHAARVVWTALAAPTPHRLLEALADPSARFFHAALRTLLRRYP